MPCRPPSVNVPRFCSPTIGNLRSGNPNLSFDLGHQAVAGSRPDLSLVGCVAEDGTTPLECGRSAASRRGRGLVIIRRGFQQAGKCLCHGRICAVMKISCKGVDTDRRGGLYTPQHGAPPLHGVMARPRSSIIDYLGEPASRPSRRAGFDGSPALAVGCGDPSGPGLFDK